MPDGGSGAGAASLADGKVGKLYVLESTPSLTGAKATERVAASSSEVVSFTIALGQEFGLGGPVAGELSLAHRAKLMRIVEELRHAGDRALVVAGGHLPPEIQALAFAVNQKLGALGNTIALSDPVAAAFETKDNCLGTTVSPSSPARSAPARSIPS
jgi:hypothetical protein